MKRLTSEMDDHIGRTWYWAIIVARVVKVIGQGIENLSRVRKVCFERVDVGGRIWKRDQVQVEDFVAFADEIWNHMSSCLSTASCENLRCVSIYSNKI